jgi:mercuric ion transport protein
MNNYFASKKLFLRSRLYNLNLSFIPTLVVALMPKCPICLLSALGLFGLTSVIGVQWLKPVVISLLVFTLAVLAFRAQRRWGYRPFALGASGALLLFIGKFQFNQQWLGYSGIVMLMAASIWNSWPKKRTNCQCSF